MDRTMEACTLMLLAPWLRLPHVATPPPRTVPREKRGKGKVLGSQALHGEGEMEGTALDFIWSHVVV